MASIGVLFGMFSLDDQLLFLLTPRKEFFVIYIYFFKTAIVRIGKKRARQSGGGELGDEVTQFPNHVWGLHAKFFQLSIYFPESI